jgi:hypothetical protein
MATKLTYPRLPDGKIWNLIARIDYKIGKWLGTWSNRTSTHLISQEDLTPQEETDINTIVGDGSTCQDPIQFALVNNRIIMKCLPDFLPELEVEAGFNIAMTYRLNGENEEMVLQATDPTYQMEKILTVQEKKAFIAAVEWLNRVE